MTNSEGASYAIDHEPPLVIARMWWSGGSATEEETTQQLRCLAALERAALDPPDVRGVVLDLRGAFPIASPRLEQAITSLVLSTSQRGCRVGIVLGMHPAQRVQMQRLLEESGARRASLFSDPVAARVFASRARDPSLQSTEIELYPGALTPTSLRRSGTR